MRDDVRDVIVVGGGVAAHRCAFRLRTQGYEGRLRLVCAESIPPYDRTALSKAMLKHGTPDPPPLSPISAYENAAIELMLDTRACRLLPERRTLVCADGTELSYDRIVLATGSAAMLPAALRAPGVQTIRTSDDIHSLREAVAASARVAIVGGGLIGCELASSLVGENRTISLVEQGSGPLSQIVGQAVAARLAAFQREAGVNLMTATRVQHVKLTREGGYELTLDQAEPLFAEVVVAAVGVMPEVDWLSGAGVVEAGAVLCNSRCATAVAGVFAAGTCASFPSVREGRTVRFEHWEAAARHGVVAADNVLDLEHEFDPISFFWSDQHGAKLAMCGSPNGDELTAIDDTADGFIATYQGRARTTAMFGLNAIRAVVGFRRELEAS